MIELARLAYPGNKWVLGKDGVTPCTVPTDIKMRFIPETFNIHDPADKWAAFLALLSKSVVIGQMPEGVYYAQGPFDAIRHTSTIEETMISAAKVLHESEGEV